MMSELLCLVYLSFSLVLMSLIEYVIHRWPMHSRWFANRFPWLRKPFFETHAVLHHGRYYKRFEHEPDIAGHHISMILSPVENVVGLFPLWGLMWLLVGPLLAATFVVVVASHAIIWSMIHKEMHEPKHGWLSRCYYYRYLCEYHRVHHDHPGTNFNAVLPGMDWLFGTYRSW